MGGQAQVVTFALDDLLGRGEQVTTALVLHFSTHDRRVRHAISQLSAEFAGGRYRGRPLVFRHLTVQAAGQPLLAIRTAQEAQAAQVMARDLLAELKRGGEQLHLCIAGGPRILALTLTTAAMLQCDHIDRLWHLYTPREFLAQARDGAILHAPSEAGVHLISVPLVPWGIYFPALQALSRPSSPALVEPSDAVCCEYVWNHISEREQEVLRVLAHGLSPQEAAEWLNIVLSTVDTHKTKIFSACRIAWELPEDKRLTYHFLREKFAPWLRFKHYT